MERIASFSVDHTKLLPGVYVSRRDKDPAMGAITTTFDLRITAPNREPVIDTAPLHCLEHMGATFFRNDAQWAPRTVYFGPMGCRTGFYLVLFGDWEPAQIQEPLQRFLEWTLDYEGDVPGASPAECGNWHDIDLNQAKWWARRWLETIRTLSPQTTTYPA